MAQHTSAGLRAYDTGLVLQARPEIDTNEFGLKQGTLRFLLANSRWPELEPVRGAKCSTFVIGNSLTESYLSGISFMAAQTKRWTHGGHCPGVGTLEVMCQGAAFHDGYESGEVTPYFNTISTTLEDLTFNIYDMPSDGTTLQATLATTAALNATYSINSSGFAELKSVFFERLTVDGIDASLNIKVLVKDQVNTAHNGLYVVKQVGKPIGYGNENWKMIRASSMDEPAEFVNTVYVNVSTGTANSGTLWNLVPGGGTFVVGTTGVTFTSASASAVTPLYNVHLQYHSIDLHYEYMAKQRQQTLRYVQDDYTVGDGDLCEITPGSFQKLEIEKAEGQALASTNPTVWAAVDRDIWGASVFYPGTGARLEQTPAGAYWHVMETVSIKIHAILPYISNVA
jgi:hypothetical protein